jgi:iron complex transport system permease protein
MLLAGIAINALCGAITGLLTYLANDAQLRSIQFWGLGSLGGATWETLQVGAIGCFCLWLLFQDWGNHNAFALGEGQATFRNQCQTFENSIDFIDNIRCWNFRSALWYNRVCRFSDSAYHPNAGGTDHRIVLPASALMGAILLTLADLISRTIVAPVELPIGIVTAIVGTPSFIAILIKNRR